MRLSLLPTLLLLLNLPVARAFGANCNAAHTPREKLVCASTTLSALDDQLNKAYEAALSQLTPASAALVRTDQHQWLPWLDKVCPEHNPAIQTEDCLTTKYNQRLEGLTKGTRRVGGILFFTRTHYVYAPGKLPAKDSDEARSDPGFGYGAFAWPQIDFPDRDHAAFNKAAYEAAIRTEAYSEDKKKVASFEEGTSTDGSVDASASIFAADEHLVDADLIAERYSWGGAHPGTARYSFLWSVALQRPLAPDDVFRAGAGWRTSLVEPAIAKLRKTDAGPNLWEGKELTDAVAAALANPQQWDLSRDGLTLTFAQYEVTCYACGTPAVTFSWPEFAPYLNPNFKPTELPEQAPDASN